MEYDEFLRQRRARMAELIRVAFRQLGGEPDKPPLSPPWFLPGAEAAWQRIAETERALRGLVRDVYSARFGDGAALSIETALPARERETLARALRARPVGVDPTIINNSADPLFRTVADSAILAVRKCSPLRIPGEFHSYSQDGRTSSSTSTRGTRSPRTLARRRA